MKPLPLLFLVLSLSLSESFGQSDQQWEVVETIGQPTARHEAAFVEFKGKLYLIGGRRINPVDVYDPATNTWTAKSKTPIELHHFQAVVHGDAIYLIGAMTGGWPNEKPLEKVVVYYPEKDEFKFVHSIPPSRRRGGAGAVIYKEKIYIVGGITNGHMDGYKPWLDCYDPKTGSWTPLADAPHARDHFSAAVVGDRLYAAAGRTTSQRTEEGFNLTVEEVDVYDFKTEKWLKRMPPFRIPTQRAGNMAIEFNGKLIIGGGESGNQKVAHNEVEMLTPQSGLWSKLPALKRGRHGSGFARIGNYLYTASGCGNRGGSPELTTLERLNVSKAKQLHIFEMFKRIQISFGGRPANETFNPNPFTDYRLDVVFTHEESGHQKQVRGFYAADGVTAHFSGKEGSLWQVRFSPDRPGKWSYKAKFRQGKNIAIEGDLDVGEELKLGHSNGTFLVRAPDPESAGFYGKGQGHIIAKDGFFRFRRSNRPWLKGGTDSPENLLAYEDFDGTFRMQTSNEDGEASTDEKLHRFEPHAADWNEGDPTWKKGKGKALIGAVNYLAERGVNSAYFLTLNINGDGKDVWPYLSPDDFTRFDCSKLEQWEIVFGHMQSKGIMLHIQTQETENETLLDGGDTGLFRKLYYLELISRFAHHPGLVWNLGEENGPAEWTPVGQTPKQRIAMADFIKANDPYNHPVVMHTHADPFNKDTLLKPLLGAKSIDGLSFQVDKPETVHGEILKWHELSEKAGHRWLIAMDEIGPWTDGVVPDSVDSSHDKIRRQVLWGSLMAGAAGVEWYFGAKFPHTDLSSEDWRQRENMWNQTTIAREFFEEHLPFTEMVSSDNLLSSSKCYCLSKPGTVYAVYLPGIEDVTVDLANESGQWSVDWFDAKSGGNLAKGSMTKLQEASDKFKLGKPPESFGDGDCLVLIRKKNQ